MNNNTKEELKKAGFVKIRKYEYYTNEEESEIQTTKIYKDVYSKIFNVPLACAIEAMGFGFKVTVTNNSYTLTKIVKCEEHNLLAEVNLLLGEFSRLVNDHD